MQRGRELRLEPDRLSPDAVLGRERPQRLADQILAVVLRLARRVDPSKARQDGIHHIRRGLVLLPGRPIEQGQPVAPVPVPTQDEATAGAPRSSGPRQGEGDQRQGCDDE